MQDFTTLSAILRAGLFYLCVAVRGRVRGVRIAAVEAPRGLAYITCMMRRVFSLSMILMLLVTSHVAAQARGAPGAVDRMVICTGVSVTVIHVDGTGQPVAVPHVCPDCALHLLDTAAPFGWVAGDGVARALDVIAPRGVRRSATGHGDALARAPPRRAALI